MNPIYYSSTSELPMFNWNQINKTHDWRYLIKDSNKIHLKQKVVFKDIKDAPEDIWNTIWIEYIDKHGLNEKLTQWFGIMKEVCRLRNEVYLYGNTHFRPLYRAKEIDAHDLMNELQGGTMEEATALLSKNMGYRVDLKEVPVDEYMAYVKISTNGKG